MLGRESKVKDNVKQMNTIIGYDAYIWRHKCIYARSEIWMSRRVMLHIMRKEIENS